MPLVLQQRILTAPVCSSVTQSNSQTRLALSLCLSLLGLSIILPTFYDVSRLAMRATDDSSSQGTTAAVAATAVAARAA